ncbi:MAG: SUF system NifU family Fe-S cluster assembly protein [Gammaproteobacteria bacterium]|nr:SUF system NifU family Fe-S cluster assembly protein [Gammaproteobacteria bacterium]MDH5302943.1 SUF system NifU family Fe-S cluster assembly protein [Gammaproteobacteria bacterium]MDH5321143.1 SUF system NifU family Fe-S cluster assembly protein [Gammaproteobacteria bacterium]
MSAVHTHEADDLRELYRELILDHARSPRHFGKLDAATHTARGINPLCGDRLQLFLQLDQAERIAAASFEGSGCAISVASASLLTDSVIGMSATEALELFTAFTAQLCDQQDVAVVIPRLGKLQALSGVREFPARVKCATLAWHALESAISQRSATATTE